MRINKRLEHIAKYVNDNEKVIDIGCDHALLSIYLEKTKKNISIIASDINEGPLNQAKKNIIKYDCKNINIKLGNGLSTIDNDTSTIIISGMGTNTIIDILTMDINKLNNENVSKIILSPNNKFYDLRKFVISIGLVIISEEFIYDRGKCYDIIVLAKGKKEYCDLEYKYGVNVILNEDYYNYLNDILNKYMSIIKDIPKTLEKHKQIEKEIIFIKKILLNFNC